jgi:hypothetical protein
MMVMTTRLTRFALGGLAVALLTACAGRSVRPARFADEAPVDAACGGGPRLVEVRNEGRTAVDVYAYQRPASTPVYLATVPARGTRRLELGDHMTNPHATGEGGGARRSGRQTRVTFSTVCPRT